MRNALCEPKMAWRDAHKLSNNFKTSSEDAGISTHAQLGRIRSDAQKRGFTILQRTRKIRKKLIGNKRYEVPTRSNFCYGYCSGTYSDHGSQ